MNRYEVQESEEGHYRLDYIVIDKTKPHYHIDDVNKELEPIDYDIACHCKDEGVAYIICRELNRSLKVTMDDCLYDKDLYLKLGGEPLHELRSEACGKITIEKRSLHKALIGWFKI